MDEVLKEASNAIKDAAESLKKVDAASLSEKIDSLADSQKALDKKIGLVNDDLSNSIANIETKIEKSTILGRLGFK